MLGFLNINKPAGISSRGVVNVVQACAKPFKAGHAGTLDPLATGVLVVAVGSATRLISRVQELPKVYRAEFLLGRQSPTDDVEGEVTICDPRPEVTVTRIEDGLRRFVGEIAQVPPAFSAVHVDGQRAYKLARRGDEVLLKPRKVRVERITLIDWQSPKLTVEIECGSGTYIRSLARDLGRQLGSGGLMSALERVAVGPFRVASSVTVEDLKATSVATHVIPPVAAVSHLPQLAVTEDELALLCRGTAISVAEDVSPDTEYAVVDEQSELAALVRYRETKNDINPTIVLQPRRGPMPLPDDRRT